MGVSTFWYKQAICYIEWSQKDNEFGNKLACLLYMNQLLSCIGVEADPSVINTDKVLDHFCAHWQDEAFCEKVHDYFREGLYELLLDELYILIECYFEPNALDYEPSDIDTFCRCCIDAYTMHRSGNKLSDLEKAHFNLRGGSTVSLMCKYLTVEDLDKLDTFSDLLLKLHGILYKERVHYTELFKKWCEKNSIRDIATEHKRLLKLFNVKTDEELDKCIELNIS